MAVNVIELTHIQRDTELFSVCSLLTLTDEGEWDKMLPHSNAYHGINGIIY